MASATSFDDELSKWHKQLQTIEAVLVTWLKVQQLWVQLEEVSFQSFGTFSFMWTLIAALMHSVLVDLVKSHHVLLASGLWFISSSYLSDAFHFYSL